MNFIPMNPKQLIFPFAIDQYPRFDNFYHSHIQQLIYSLSRSLQESTESEFVITGTERSGKSFLLQAICNEYKLIDKQAFYLPMKVAINMEADFIENFDIYDALCIDDVHLVHNHPKWQEMIFHLINQSKENECNLYFGTEESILELDLLPDLSSRLSRMQSLQILSVPDNMLKEALNFCAAKLEISLDQEVIDYLMKREKREFQHLFSLLKHLDQASAQQKRKITIPFAKQILLS